MKFDNIEVNIDQSSGDIVYFNHGDFVFNDKIKLAGWKAQLLEKLMENEFPPFDS